MPLTRYLVKNEYGLADPEMYRSADKDDPEALLEGVAMAGLVGLLRQLGDLAEFAAEIFHDLHEEVMATAARGHGLMIRIQQLEAEFPPIEKALLLQTNHSLYYTNSGVEWHPNLQMEQNLIARGDLPRFVMDSYEESRGPPRLFLLDKFDVAGAGACLKRYSDPSFFKVERLPDSIPTVEVHREKKVRKAKKKGARWRYGETPETVPASHAKLHQLFMEEQIENAYNDPKRRVKLKKRPLNGSLFDSKSGKSYMEKFVECPSPESKTIHEVSVLPLSLKWKQDDTSESGLEVVEVGTIRDAPSPNFQRKHFMDDLEDFKPTIDGERDEVSSTSHAAVEKKELLFNGDDNGEGSMDGYHSDEMTSEVDNYLDALATVESEMETDNDSRSRHNMTLLDIVKGGTDSDANEDMELQTETFGSQSVGHPASDDGDTSFGRSSSSQRTDRASRMGGSTQFVGDRFSKVFPPSDSTITDPGNLPDDQLTDKKEPFGMESKNTGVEGDAICDLRVASQTLCSANLESTCAPLNSGLRSSVGSEQDETKPDHIKDATGSSDSDEARTNLVDSSTLPYDNVPNHIEGDNLATISMKHLPVDELEDERLNGCPVVMEHSDDLELTSGYQSRDKVPNTGGVAESWNGVLLRMDSPQSRLSLEEQHQHSSSASLLRDSDDEQVCSAGDRVNDAMPAPIVDLEKTAVLAEQQQVHVENQRLVETVNDRNSSDLDLQHKGGDEVFGQTLDGENIDCVTYNTEASGGESGNPIHPDIPYGGSDGGSNPGDTMPIRVSLDDTTAIKDEWEVLVENHQYLEEAENVSLHEDNLLEVDIQRESCKGVTQDGENPDTLTCNFEAGVGVTVPLVPSDGKDTVVDDSVIQGVQAEGVGNSRASVAEVVVVPQERVDFFEAKSPGWTKESGVEEKVREEVAHADLDTASAADWDLIAHGDVSTAVSFNGSSLSKQTQSELFHDTGTIPTDLELGNADHALLRLENATSSQSILLAASTTASEESPKLLFDEPAIDLHLANDENAISLNLQAEQVLSVDLLDQEKVFIHKSETASEYESGLQEEACDTEFRHVTGSTQLLACQNEEVESPNSLNQEKEEGSVVHFEKVFIHKSEAASEYESGLQEEAQETEFQQVARSTQLLACQNEEVQSPNSLNQEKEEGSVVHFENFLIQQPSLTESLQEPIFDTGAHNFCLLSEGGEVKLPEMPPLPPLPPLQWRMGKPQNVPSTQEVKFPQFGLGLFPPVQPSLPDENPQIGFTAFEAGTPLSHTPLSHNPFMSPMRLETENPAESYPCASQLPLVHGDSGVHSYDKEVKPLLGSLWQDPTFGEPSEQYSLASDTKPMQGSPSSQSVGVDISLNPHPGSPLAELAQHVEQSSLKTDAEFNNLQHKDENADSYDKEVKPLSGSPWQEPTFGELSEQYSLASDTKSMQGSPPSQSVGVDISLNPHPGSPLAELAQHVEQSLLKTDAEVNNLQHKDENADGEDSSGMADMKQEPWNPLNSAEERSGSTDQLASLHTNESEKPSGTLIGNIPRPPRPLIEAVAAHDRSKLRKVAERVKPQLAPKLEERDSLLEQIRTKSFNLKPATATRPSIQQGPQTNLKVAAILEKANAIRQALAGSDEDDDADSWSE